MIGKQIELPTTSFGLALGGLAGNNAHGAGVLQAALELRVAPDMISCSSGQINWVYRYLKYRNISKIDHRRGLLRADLEQDLSSDSPTSIEALNAAIKSLVGKQGVFRPALPEFPLNMIRNLLNAWTTILTDVSINWQTLFSAYRELARVLPAQSLVPLFPDRFFQDISDDFNQTQDVGLVLNSYDVFRGEEYVYCNDRARDLLNIEFGARDSYRQGTVDRRISPEAVREGLWIYEYGEPRNVSAIDGAYFRQIILSELAPVHTIYVARPLNSCWLGSFPDSWIGLQDLKTEVNFNGSYAGERDKIYLINQLLQKKQLVMSADDEKTYHPIELIEFELETQRGFFDYTHESVTVFDRAYDIARSMFSSHERSEKGSP